METKYILSVSLALLLFLSGYSCKSDNYESIIGSGAEVVKFFPQTGHSAGPLFTIRTVKP